MVLQAHRNRCWHNVVVYRIGSCLPFHSNTLLQCLTLDVHFRPSRPFVIMWSLAHGKQPTLAVLSTTRLYAMRGPYVIFHDRTSYCHFTHTISSVIGSPNSSHRGRLHLHRSLLCYSVCAAWSIKPKTKLPSLVLMPSLPVNTLFHLT